MATADSSEVRLYYYKEVTPGTTPASAPQEFRFTGESLSADTETAPNPEIRPGRQVQDEIRTRMEPRGDVNIVISARSHDVLYEGVMTGAWGTAQNTSANTIAAVVTSGTDHTLTGTGIATNLSVGDFFEVRGFTGTPANNGIHQVIAKPDNNTIRVWDGSKGRQIVADAAGETVTIKSRPLKNGSVKNYFTIEKLLNDVTQYFAFKGCLLGGLSMTIEPNRILEGAFTNIIGRTPTRSGTLAGSGAAQTVSTYKVMDAINSVGDVKLGGVASVLELSRLAFQIDNGLRGKPAIGVQGNADVALSDFGVTGELVAYFDGANAAAVYDQWLSNTATSLAWSLHDAEATPNYLIFSFPTIKWQSIEVVAGAKGQDMVLNCRFRAIEDATMGITMAMYRNYDLA